LCCCAAISSVAVSAAVFSEIDQDISVRLVKP